VGSGCDTIDSVAAIQPLTLQNNLLRIMPNPADKYLYVEMGMPATAQGGKQGDYEFQLINGLGKIVDIKETKQVDIFDTESLASGVYFVKAVDKSNSNQFITKQVVVQH
jgi:hypothetical protein